MLLRMGGAALRRVLCEAWGEMMPISWTEWGRRLSFHWRLEPGARGTPGNSGCLVLERWGLDSPGVSTLGQMLDSSERSPQTSSSSSWQPEQERGTCRWVTRGAQGRCERASWTQCDETFQRLTRHMRKETGKASGI